MRLMLLISLTDRVLNLPLKLFIDQMELTPMENIVSFMRDNLALICSQITSAVNTKVNSHCVISGSSFSKVRGM